MAEDEELLQHKNIPHTTKHHIMIHTHEPSYVIFDYHICTTLFEADGTSKNQMPLLEQEGEFIPPPSPHTSPNTVGFSQ